MTAPVGYSEKQALRWLASEVQSDLEPVLTTDDLRDMLAVCRIADEDGNLPDPFDRWVARTEYAIGERVVASPRNGYVYRVTAAGVSGNASPTWSTTLDATVTDGGVTWTVEDTAPWVPTFDAIRINKAAGNGWRRKADKLQEGETYSSDGMSDHPEVRRQYCLDRAARYDRKGAGTITVGGDDYLDRYARNVVVIS